MKVCSLCRRCCDDSVPSCTEGHPPLSEFRSGSCEMIPGYHLEELLDSGLKGETYRAREKVSGRTCLIKLLPANEANREQFLYEARLAATIFHPNIADVYEADSLDSGELYVVAEDPEGETAREILNSSGKPQLLKAIQIVRQAAEAVHALHLKGLIHRAVSPENIVVMSDPSGELVVKIQNPDFGGFAVRSIVSNKFLIDTAVGSLRYFAPEQCSGEPESIKTDIYALGIVLYEMIAGVPPFDAQKGAALIQMHRSLPPPEIRIDNFDLRMLLTHTLMESLQKHPRTRQSSANAFARQLRHMEQLATHVSTPPPAGVVPVPPPPRQVAVAATTAVATNTVAAPDVVVLNPSPVYPEAVQPVIARVVDELAPATAKSSYPAPPSIDPVLPIRLAQPEATPLPVISESESSFAALDLKGEPTPIKHIQGPLDDIPDMPEMLDDIPDMPDMFDDIPDMPESLDEVESVEKVIDEPVPVPAEAELPETEIVNEEPRHIFVQPLPVSEAAALVAIPAAVTVPEPVQVEPEFPEIPIALAELQIAEPVIALPAPAKIVWDGLEDDIPSEEDVQAALLEEQLAEEQPPAIVAEPVMLEPVYTESIPPEVAIVRPEPQVIHAAPITPAPAKITPAPAKIVCEGLDDDIPSEAEAQAALLEDEPAQPVPVPPLPQKAAAAYLFEEKPRPVVVPEVVTVRKPARRAEKRKPVYQPAEDQMFAAYGGRSWPAVNVNYRSVLIGAGILTMAIVFFVGRVVMTESFAGNGPVKTVEAETVKGQPLPVHSAQQNVVTPGKVPEVKSFESTPPSEEELDARQLKPIQSEEGARSPRQMFFPTPSAKPADRDMSAATSEVTPRVQPPVPTQTAVAKNTAKPLPFTPSVVIPYKGPQKGKTSNEKDCTDQPAAPPQTRTTQAKAANITRPRVVRDPQN